MKEDTCVLILRALAVVALVMTMAATATAQTEKIIHTFAGGSDGANPVAGLILDSQGNLYGTTTNGGNPFGGIVFELSPGVGGTWTKKILHDFGSQTDGAVLESPLTFDSKGNLYGTTVDGGDTASGSGTVFELSPGSDGTWTEKVLYSFTGGADGAYPTAGVVLDSSGNIYGTTTNGGTSGWGTAFELVAGSGETWTEKVLHSFTGGNDGGYLSGSTLILDGVGNLYGVAYQGGVHDYGVVFKLTRGSSWSYKVIYAFPGGCGGSNPAGNLVLDRAGNLYGMASYIVFELSPNSSGTWTAKALHNFAGGSDGANPYGGLAFDKAGNLYGTTGDGGAHRGTVFELIPSSGGTWTEKILHRFSSTGGDGVYPLLTTPAIDATGHVYGTTELGGASNNGVVFEITP